MCVVKLVRIPDSHLCRCGCVDMEEEPEGNVGLSILKCFIRYIVLCLKVLSAVGWCTSEFIFIFDYG